MDGGLVKFELTKALDKNNSETAVPKVQPGLGAGQVKIVRSREQAFEEFDKLEESQGRVQFVLKPSQWYPISQQELPPLPQVSAAPHVALPPLPAVHEVEYLFRNALLLIDAGDYELSRNLLIEVVNQDPCHAEALRWLGWCEKQTGDLQQAEICYEQLAILRGTPKDIFEYGEILYALNRDDEAIQLWFQASRLIEAEDPLLFDLFKGIGNAFTRMGDWESAQENYNKALMLRPDSDALQVNIATLAFQQNQPVESEEHFQKACTLNPRNEKAWCGLGLVAAQTGDLERARSLVQQALDIDQSCMTALQLLVQWAEQDRRFDEAIAGIENHLRFHVEDMDMRYALAGLQFQAGWVSEALGNAEGILAQKPDDQNALELLKIIQQRDV